MHIIYILWMELGNVSEDTLVPNVSKSRQPEIGFSFGRFPGIGPEWTTLWIGWDGKIISAISRGFPSLRSETPWTDWYGRTSCQVQVRRYRFTSGSGMPSVVKGKAVFRFIRAKDIRGTLMKSNEIFRKRDTLLGLTNERGTKSSLWAETGRPSDPQAASVGRYASVGEITPEKSSWSVRQRNEILFQSR